MELFAKPGVGGIIEKSIDGVDYILIQDRCKKDAIAEVGLLEIPAGKIREFENIFDCLRREIWEETGLEVIYIEGEKEIETVEYNGYQVINYTPFSCSQNILGEYPIMVQTFICKAKGDLLLETNESKNIRWISLAALKILLDCNEESFYPMHVATLKKYLNKMEVHSIGLATERDLDEMESLYNSLHDHLQTNTNYPGWIRGVYPTRETAAVGINNNTLFVLKIKNEIAGSMILNHAPEDAYAKATWGIDINYENIIVIHSLAVHPKYSKRGIGKLLMDYAKTYSIEQKMKAIRLDVSIHNTPAIKLYEESGYQYVATIDLGLNIPNLIWFHFYEMIL